MTVYAELLKLALAEGGRPQRSVEELWADVAARRSALNRDRDAAARLASALAYDAALVRLCEALGVAHALTAGSDGAAARQRAENALAARVPDMVGALR